MPSKNFITAPVEVKQVRIADCEELLKLADCGYVIFENFKWEQDLPDAFVR